MLPEWLWWSPSGSARIVRAALSPISALFALVVRLRNAMFDRRIVPARVPRLPALAVGNITVGGTGKTPVSSWLATQLQARGARPAIVLRGYGDDEPLVHERLTPSIPVVVNANRLEAIERAAASGADVAVLDDAFQHRHVARVADVVLVSADAPDGPERMLPTGPYREPYSALRRATLVIVTRKAAPLARAREVVARVNIVAPGVTHGDRASRARSAWSSRTAHPLRSYRLPGVACSPSRAWATAPRSANSSRRPALSCGCARFRDHHPFTAGDAESLARSLGPDEIALCTLKDAVKLLPLWPREAVAIGYVSQAVIVEERGDAIDAILDLVINARLRQL